MGDERGNEQQGSYGHPDADWTADDEGGEGREGREHAGDDASADEGEDDDPPDVARARRPAEVPGDAPDPGPGELESDPPEGPRPRREREAEEPPPDGPVPDAEPGPDGDPRDPARRGGPGEPLEVSWRQRQRRYPAQERPKDRAGATRTPDAP